MRLVLDEEIPLPRIWAKHRGAYAEGDLSAKYRRGGHVAERAREAARNKTAEEARAKETRCRNNRQYERGSYTRPIGNTKKPRWSTRTWDPLQVGEDDFNLTRVRCQENSTVACKRANGVHFGACPETQNTPFMCEWLPSTTERSVREYRMPLLGDPCKARAPPLASQ